MTKEIRINGKVIGKKYGIVKTLSIKNDTNDSCIDAPSVIYDGKVYKMWYSNHNGNHNRIYYATSTDGKVWNNSGMITLIDSDGCNINASIYNPHIIFDGGIYKMWYTGRDEDTTMIHYATSVDGILWYKYGVVLYIDVFYDDDDYAIHAPCVIKDGTTYKMWYSGYDGSNWNIRYATSTDGITWFKDNIKLPIGTSCTSEDIHIDSPYVIKDGSTYKMWYSAHNGSRNRIHYATSIDSITWTKHGVILPLGTVGESDYTDTDSPCVIKVGSTYKIWYSGYDDKRWRIHYAELLELD